MRDGDRFGFPCAGIEEERSQGQLQPPCIRVATYDRVFRSHNGDAERQFHKVVAAWRWTASSNRYSWWRNGRQDDRRRGAEVRVEAGDPDRPPATCARIPTTSRTTVHHKYSLMVGMGCRPRANRFRYRWAHIITNEAANDGLQPSVSPGHYKDGHNTASPTESEIQYCHDQDDKPGSCLLADHGVAVKIYNKTTDGGTMLQRPGQALFER
jgi:hypothetical protein